MRVSAVVAADEQDVIGRAGGLPWVLPGDLRHFKELTSRHVVVVGRRTQESIVARLGKPLPERITVVVTRRDGLRSAGTVLYEHSVGSALSVARAIEEFAGRDEVFVIGGAMIYAEALPEVERVYLTRVHARTDGDVTMPAGWLDDFTLLKRDGPFERAADTAAYSFLEYARR